MLIILLFFDFDQRTVRCVPKLGDPISTRTVKPFNVITLFRILNFDSRTYLSKVTVRVKRSDKIKVQLLEYVCYLRKYQLTIKIFVFIEVVTFNVIILEMLTRFHGLMETKYYL